MIVGKSITLFSQKLSKKLWSSYTHTQSKITHKGEQFCFTVDDAALFMWKSNLDLLAEWDIVLGDGTFTYSPHFLEQMYTLHIYRNNFYLPVVFCFLHNKKTSTYVTMRIKVSTLCHQNVGEKLNVRTFCADFEKAAHNAVTSLFPKCEIRACKFHLGQSWFRHIQKNRIMLQEYNTK